MLINTFLTPRRCALYIFVVICVVCLVGSRFLLAVRQVDSTTDSQPTGESGGDSESRKSVDARPILSDCTEHLNWFVQISDLHLSIFHDNHRLPDLRYFCKKDIIHVLKPQVVLVTGDITDAKLEDREGSMQFEDEWKQYNKLLRETGVLDKTIWLDTRGNHDAFNVPSLTSVENYYGVYGTRAGKNGGLSYHYPYKTEDGDTISFIAVDACPNPGPKRPFNFFGVLAESELKRIEGFVAESRHSNHTIFFGHYPTSTISGSVSQIRQLFSNGSLYVCGHLHTLGGLFPHMYARQQSGYLELELPDWKDQRIYRIIAVDHDLISFVDVYYDSWPVVLITNPKHSRFLLPEHEPTSSIKDSTHIRILVFSPSKVTFVGVKVDGIFLGQAHLVVKEQPLYVLPWEPFRYSGGLHNIEVNVRTASGDETLVTQTFSFDDTRPAFDFLQRFVIMSDHAAILKTIFVACFLLSVVPLVLFHFVHIHCQIPANGANRLTNCCVLLSHCWLRRFCLLCSTPSIFYPLLFYNIYIVVGPWFVGEIISGHFGACFLFGFLVKGTYIPTVLTYLYGALQILLFNIPLTFYLGRCLDLTRLQQHRDTTKARGRHRGRLWPIIWLLDHSFFLVLIGFQAYLVLYGFYRAYGFIAFIICPLRTWAIVMAIVLRRQAMSIGPKVEAVPVDSGCPSTEAGNQSTTGRNRKHRCTSIGSQSADVGHGAHGLNSGRRNSDGLAGRQ